MGWKMQISKLHHVTFPYGNRKNLERKINVAEVTYNLKCINCISVLHNLHILIRNLNNSL